MISTKDLEKVIEKTLRDKNVIHSSVKKVGKAPDYFAIKIGFVSPWSDEADLRIVMGWEAEEFVRRGSIHQNYVGGITRDPSRSLEDRIMSVSWQNANALRFKWFRRVHDTLEAYGAGVGLAFVASCDEFEFGAGDGCIWASLHISAVPAGSITRVRSD